MRIFWNKHKNKFISGGISLFAVGAAAALYILLNILTFGVAAAALITLVAGAYYVAHKPRKPFWANKDYYKYQQNDHKSDTKKAPPSLQLTNDGHLDLSNKELADGDLHTLAYELRTNKKITSVDLSNNNITEEGAKRLARASQFNRNLKSLTLTGNAIGQTAREYFRRKFSGKKGKISAEGKLTNRFTGLEVQLDPSDTKIRNQMRDIQTLIFNDYKVDPPTQKGFIERFKAHRQARSEFKQKHNNIRTKPVVLMPKAGAGPYIRTDGTPSRKFGKDEPTYANVPIAAKWMLTIIDLAQRGTLSWSDAREQVNKRAEKEFEKRKVSILKYGHASKTESKQEAAYSFFKEVYEKTSSDNTVASESEDDISLTSSSPPTTRVNRALLFSSPDDVMPPPPSSSSHVEPTPSRLS